MDGGARRGRQNEQQVHTSSTGRYALTDTPQTERIPGTAGNDRYRGSTLTPVSSASRGASASASYTTYYQEPTAAFNTTGMPTGGMNYGADYGSDTRQQNSTFSNYTSASVMYNVAQPSAAQGPVYDSPAFTARQAPGALQIMTPEVASTYFGAEPSNSSSHGSVQQPNVYQQTSGLGFSSSMPGMTSIPQAPASADVSMTEDPDHAERALEERWINYKRQMASVFQDISSGALQHAAETLSTVTSWLLSQVSDLGLTMDDASLQADREQLWKNFNVAWLALGRAQKEAMLNGERPATLLSREAMKDMVDELVRLGDGIERHGLLDYGIGVWEERIVEDCLSLFPDDEEHRSASR